MPVMDTEKETPFSFELLAVVHDISNQLFRYQEFFLAVEELFTEREKSLQKMVESELERLPESHHEDVIEHYAWESNENQVLFPSMHRESMFITLYNYLEHNLNSVCLSIGNEIGSGISLKDLKGSGVERAQTFLKLIPQFEFKKIPNVLLFLKGANSLRNVVVHAGAILPDNRGDPVNVFVATQSNLAGSPGHFVIFKADFVHHFIKSIQLFF